MVGGGGFHEEKAKKEVVDEIPVQYLRITIPPICTFIPSLLFMMASYILDAAFAIP